MKVEKIFRYETYKINNYLIIDSPLLNLVEPTFSLDNTTLYIYLNKSTVIYYFADLTEMTINSINNKTCYIKEIDNNGKFQTHQILI